MNSYRVLVVDDMQVNLKILENILTNAGYETVLVSSGEEALEVVKDQQFHCILLDIIMPGIDGFEVIKRLKHVPTMADVPVIFITGEEGPEATVRGFEAGAVDYITKPFHPHEVQVRVKSHIKLYTTIQSLATAQAETLKQINNAQNSLLKKPEDYPQANFSVYYCSLHAAGGDIYDIIEITPTKFAYFVGDFAGHQISTGFLTSSVKALLQQNCNDMMSPSETMRIVNSVLCQLMKPGQYLTACYAVLDTESSELTVVNMGHPPLLVKQFIGDKIVEVGRGGDVLGVFEDAFYQEDTLQLIPGDRLLLYTDGLIEGKSVWSASTRTLKNKLLELEFKGRDEFVEDLLAVTEDLRGEVTDDIMLLLTDVPGETPQVITEESDMSLKIVFPSTTRLSSEMARTVFHWISNRAELRDKYGLKLVLNEAISNAVIHGNVNDYRKNVTIGVEISSMEIVLYVEDEGKGFDWRKKQLAGNMDDTAAYNGRGLPLFTAYGFSAEYNDIGNRLELRMSY